MTSYRIVDCRADSADPQDVLVDSANSPEDAALRGLGEVLVRSGRRSDLRARVYYQHPGQAMSMVRLYTKAIDRPQ